LELYAFLNLDIYASDELLASRPCRITTEEFSPVPNEKEPERDPEPVPNEKDPERDPEPVPNEKEPERDPEPVRPL
jgi:hypothetical protein